DESDRVIGTTAALARRVDATNRAAVIATKIITESGAARGTATVRGTGTVRETGTERGSTAIVRALR
ncbi:Uncharacterized protein DAT39_007701, partial [Clarias magur]